MKRSALQRRTPPKAKTALKRGGPMKRSTTPKRRRSISQASPAQRAKVRDIPCIVTGLDRHEATIDPAHLVSRAQGGCDDPDCVIPLARHIHRAFDDGKLSLLEYLEPHHRREIAHAVEHLGLLGALQRLTGQRWQPTKGTT